jgi:alpha-methylacyl-CoA racemase
VVEFVGIGPGPMCAMLLADLGADILRIDRVTPSGLGIDKPTRFDVLARGRESVAIDIKQQAGVALALDLVAGADALIEGFRPGTMERLGLGPDACFARNPRLAYGRMTGWGQGGPLAATAGHDLDYIALVGALAAIGRAGQPPTPPLNLVGDFGGGALYLAFGLVCAMLETERSGQGQVVDAAMVDGAASLMAMFYGLAAAGLHSAERGANRLDSGAPNYEVYRCADGLYIAAAPLEPKFREVFLRGIGLDPAALGDLADPANWPRAKQAIAERIATRPRDAWVAELEMTDACVAPVLTMAEAPSHPHHRARDSFLSIDGVTQPAPAPRFSRTPAPTPTPPREAGSVSDATLAAWGITPERAAELRASGVIATPKKA